MQLGCAQVLVVDILNIRIVLDGRMKKRFIVIFGIKTTNLHEQSLFCFFVDSFNYFKEERFWKYFTTILMFASKREKNGSTWCHAQILEEYQKKPLKKFVNSSRIEHLPMIVFCYFERILLPVNSFSPSSKHPCRKDVIMV